MMEPPTVIATILPTFAVRKPVALKNVIDLVSHDACFLWKSMRSPSRSSSDENLFCCRLFAHITEELLEEALGVVSYAAHLFVNFVLQILIIDPESLLYHWGRGKEEENFGQKIMIKYCIIMCHLTSSEQLR
jgi:hypothetical protein